MTGPRAPRPPSTRPPAPAPGAARPRTKERRALSQQVRPAPIDRYGDPRVAEVLARALDVTNVGEEHEHNYTHGFHSYPARMHPLTARRAIAALSLPPGAWLVDPFCGSGTVLVEATLAGARAFGLDANPLAALIARAKVWRRPAARRRALIAASQRIGMQVVEEGKEARRSGYEPPPRRPPPPGITATERDARLKGWFDPHVRRELELIASFVDQEPDEELAALLRAVLSSVIIKVSRKESDTSGQMIARKLARGMAARIFVQRADELVVGLTAIDSDALASKSAPPPEVFIGDARSLPRKDLPDGSVAAIVTSPPYAGTYDYLEHHALRLLMLGLPVAEFDAKEIGSRRSFGATPLSIAAGLKRWSKDLKQTLSQMERVLVSGGRAVLLFGDSMAGRGPAAQPVYADSWLTELAPEVGLEVVAAASAARLPLGGTEHRAFAERGKREHLVMLRKK